MSTSGLDALLRRLEEMPDELFAGETKAVRAARNELKAIRRAARAMERYGWLDFCRSKFMVHRDEEAAMHLMESIATEEA